MSIVGEDVVVAEDVAEEDVREDVREGEGVREDGDGDAPVREALSSIAVPALQVALGRGGEQGHPKLYSPCLRSYRTRQTRQTILETKIIPTSRAQSRRLI